jgi:glycyl-tRNA synthetase alpha chain
MKTGCPPRTFQDLIFTLQQYHPAGVRILRPYDTEVGAGTFTPPRSRAVGPNPGVPPTCSPSRRPTDGRHGEILRLQHYYQYQVVIKPRRWRSGLYFGSPAEPRRRPAAHDVRFVEDNWES